jgi:hypothetical protein
LRNAFLTLEFWKQPEVSWSQVKKMQQMIRGGDAFSYQKLLDLKQRMCRRVVMVKNQ